MTVNQGAVAVDEIDVHVPIGISKPAALALRHDQWVWFEHDQIT